MHRVLQAQVEVVLVQLPAVVIAGQQGARLASGEGVQGQRRLAAVAFACSFAGSFAAWAAFLAARVACPLEGTVRLADHPLRLGASHLPIQTTICTEDNDSVSDNTRHTLVDDKRG